MRSSHWHLLRHSKYLFTSTSDALVHFSTVFSTYSTFGEYLWHHWLNDKLWVSLVKRYTAKTSQGVDFQFAKNHSIGSRKLHDDVSGRLKAGVLALQFDGRTLRYRTRILSTHVVVADLRTVHERMYVRQTDSEVRRVVPWVTTRPLQNQITILAKSSRYSQECINPRRHYFVCLTTLTFDHTKINEIPRLMVDNFDVKFGNPSCSGFRVIVRKKVIQTERHTDRQTPWKTLTSAWVNYSLSHQPLCGWWYLFSFQFKSAFPVRCRTWFAGFGGFMPLLSAEEETIISSYDIELSPMTFTYQSDLVRQTSYQIISTSKDVPFYRYRSKTGRRKTLATCSGSWPRPWGHKAFRPISK